MDANDFLSQVGGTAERKTRMKFVVGSGEQFMAKMQSFPARFAYGFASSKLLAVCVTSDAEVIAACGILNLSNYVIYYVKQEYRDQGLGTRIIRKTINTARKRGLVFLHSSASTTNVPSLHLQRKFFRKIVYLEKWKYLITMLPLTLRGELLYVFLHLTCSKLPETLIAYTIDLLMRVTGGIRELTISTNQAKRK